MDVWRMKKWERVLAPYPNRRTGLRFCYEPTVNADVKGTIHRFGLWVRREFRFPLRVIVYVKGAERIRARDGDLVVGTFFEPYCYEKEPHIRIATGDYPELLEKRGRDDAMADMLASLIHELTHYFQWVNDLQLTDAGSERQADAYTSRILGEYAATRDHP